jgi:DNA polymerase/3'-5' exonuclease PolX
MSSGTRRTLAEATRIAYEFRALFNLCYDEWEIAGSIRRKRPDVGDAEHVVRPRSIKRTVYEGLFATEKEVNAVWERADELVADGVVVKHLYGGSGFRWGDKYRGMEFGGMLHEIFLADHNNWGCHLLIRTGPAQFSTRVVDTFKTGGMYRQQDGYLKRLDGSIVPVFDEQTYLKLAGIPWVKPEARH